MKGQILHVTSADRKSRQVEAFLESEELELVEASEIWTARLAGSIVAIASTHRTADGIELRDIHVSEPLRRKNVGRYFVREIRRLASSGRDRAVMSVEKNCSDHPFFDAISSELD